MLKKVLFLASMILVVSLFLSACAPKAAEPAMEEKPAEAAAPAEATAPEEVVDPIKMALEFADRAAAGEKIEFAGSSDVTIGVVMPALDNDGWRAIYIGALSKIIETGANLITLDARNTVETQLAMIEDMITQGVDAIVFIPVDSAALSTGVVKANEAGIPVVSMDRSTEGGDVTALVESDNTAIGAEGAQLMADMADKLGIDKGNLKVLEVLGDLATSAGKERHDGFSSKAKELGLNVVTEAPAYWDAEKANAAVLDAFQAKPEINAIYLASGCAYYSGVEPALKSIGKLVARGSEGHILFITTDGCPAPLQAIRDGFVDADSAQQLVTMGKTAIEIAVNAAKGTKPAESIVRLGPDPITPDNVDDIFHWANAINTAN
jgi:ABC-type sugar transport system substrate-binding protein